MLSSPRCLLVPNRVGRGRWYLLLPLMMVAVPLLVAQESKEQERAVAELRKVGATVKMDGQDSAKRVVAVDLAGCTVPITDATVAHLKGLTRVRILDL